jgi:hypothetical protein
MPGRDREAHTEIPCKRVTGILHRIVHDYLGVGCDMFQEVSTRYILPLVRALEGIVPPAYRFTARCKAKVTGRVEFGFPAFSLMRRLLPGYVVTVKFFRTQMSPFWALPGEGMAMMCAEERKLPERISTIPCG